MHLGILADAQSWYFRDLSRAARDAGHECTRLEFAQLAGGVSENRATFGPPSGDGGLNGVDCVLVRSMPLGSLEQVVFRMDVLARLEGAGVPVVNPPKSLECAIDKYLTTSRLAAAGLPVPDTVVCQTTDEALAAREQLGGDVVVKPLFGAEGRGIVRVSDTDMGWRVFSTLERIGAVLYLQRYIDHGGSDVRVLVLGGRVLGGMKRIATTGFRTNVSQQGRAEQHPPTDREADLALRAVAAVGAQFAGVDLLYDRDGRCHVIEVNGVPGWKAFARVNEMDVAAAFVEWLGTL
uniref:RimK family alpha-L-glutamate ligase n=1 Tax=Schlesneria paludicola TaxID=360056 RepID=A0A7C2NWH0_9PLAN